MKRRELNGMVASGLALLAGSSLATFARAQQTDVPPPAKQADYLFWLSERERAMARGLATQVAAELDGKPPHPGRVSGIYQRGAPALRKRSPEAAFVSRLTKYREGKGRLRERAFQGVEGGFNFLPNYPDGQYSIVTFDTMFEATSVLYTEQITLSRDLAQGGHWQFVDYYLAIKPFYTY